MLTCASGSSRSVSSEYAIAEFASSMSWSQATKDAATVPGDADSFTTIGSSNGAETNFGGESLTSMTDTDTSAKEPGGSGSSAASG